MSSGTSDIGEFIIENLPEHPADIVMLVAQKFGISRQKAHGHLLKQIKQGKVIKVGQTRASKYFLPTADNFQFSLNLQAKLQEDIVWTKYMKPMVKILPENVLGICQYGFTEILNNAIDHSTGKSVHCHLVLRDGKIEIIIKDDGIGIFHKIQKALHLETPREAILHLSKGKFTTDPKNHTGEGIFFSSRMFDSFCILSDNLFFTFSKGDWLLSQEHLEEMRKGTYISMEIDITSERTTREVFDEYANAERGFHKTIVAVALSADPTDPHVSRSQAKRLLVGLDRFRSVVLDFHDVHGVGPAFIDEIFRVFQNEHPHIEISCVRETPEIKEMIQRVHATT
ncbi:ArsR family transcriptional regulator [Candidatus Peregrinibacteria bacterium CG10_big_fil_rev_8_21_14_0_10_49_10]|nr:MAG: ArsR family transcriptional regulator [Candidatus Peregrinibacteria bacterium CG10_big_fil_rev_8_21_14_0_10_49_10]